MSPARVMYRTHLLTRLKSMTPEECYERKVRIPICFNVYVYAFVLIIAPTLDCE
jgi:hypothetical protein